MGDDGRYRFDVHATASDSEAINRTLYAWKLGDFEHGLFVQSFSDLLEATRGREDLDFATLAPQLYAEASKDEEAFEAFGIKVPISRITNWGLIFLIAVQIYFLMYLRRLFDKLKPDDPGWDVPWIAMDQSAFAVFMYLLTVVLLPARECLSFAPYPSLRWDRVPILIQQFVPRREMHFSL